jgi:hypothetical protein
MVAWVHSDRLRIRIQCQNETSRWGAFVDTEAASLTLQSTASG